MDNFWNNTLPIYFKREKLYGIEQEQRSLEGVFKQCANVTIRYIKNGDSKKIVLFEDKRRGLETKGAEWRNALNQLTNYLKLARSEQSDKDTLYGAVTIRTYVSFYSLAPYAQVMTEYREQTTPFELKDNEDVVHTILNVWSISPPTRRRTFRVPKKIHC